jgi:hypothetical protein
MKNARFTLPCIRRSDRVFDFETTGLCAKTDSIIQIAAVKYVPGADSHPHMQQLIHVDRPLPRFITREGWVGTLLVIVAFTGVVVMMF